jgi:hypothetical protein
MNNFAYQYLKNKTAANNIVKQAFSMNNKGRNNFQNKFTQPKLNNAIFLIKYKLYIRLIAFKKLSFQTKHNI